MCGRQRVSLSRQRVCQAAGVPENRWRDAERYQPSPNVSPGHDTPILRQSQEEERLVQTMRWGLVPTWTKPDDRPDYFRMFNARSESVEEKSVFKRLLASHRCVALLQGFYEWAKEGKGKQPYYIYRGNEDDVMRMAGLFDVWNGPDGQPLYTFTILTTDSSPRLQWLHNRMPVILATPEAEKQWLANEGPLESSELASICKPYNGEDLKWHPVTPAMGKASYQSQDCYKDIKRPNIASFFAAKPGKTAFGKQGGSAAGGPQSPTAINTDERPKEGAKEQAAACKAEPDVVDLVDGADVAPKKEEQSPPLTSAAPLKKSPAAKRGAGAAVTPPKSAKKAKKAENGQGKINTFFSKK